MRIALFSAYRDRGARLRGGDETDWRELTWQTSTQAVAAALVVAGQAEGLFEKSPLTIFVLRTVVAACLAGFSWFAITSTQAGQRAVGFGAADDGGRQWTFHYQQPVRKLAKIVLPVAIAYTVFEMLLLVPLFHVTTSTGIVCSQSAREPIDEGSVVLLDFLSRPIKESESRLDSTGFFVADVPKYELAPKSARVTINRCSKDIKIDVTAPTGSACPLGITAPNRDTRVPILWFNCEPGPADGGP
jgi:hypothetical protein